MKNIYFVKRFGAVAVLLLMAVGVFAQSALRTGYFLQGNPYRYRLNAALMNDQNYIALPVLGNIGINAAGNVGLANFVYDAPNGRDLVTFMHPSVDADDFLGDIDSDNQIRANIDLLVLSGGFFAFGGYNTIDVGVCSDL